MLWTNNSNTESTEINTKILIVLQGLVFHPKLYSVFSDVQTTWACKEH